MQLGLGLGLGRYSGGTNLAGAASIFQDAAVAYSLRNLGLGDTNVVRVRRSTNNAEQDFTASEITDGTLTSFCGAGDGFVSVWYDQKGQFNFTQPIALNQPQIVSSGSVNLLNGKPIIKRVSDNGTMLGSYPLNGTNRQVFFVGEMTYINQSGRLIGSSGPADYNLSNQQGSTSTIVNNNSTLINERLNASTFNYSTRGDIYNSFLQQILLSYNADYSFFDNRLMLGYRPNVNTVNLGMYDMQELILFETPKNVEEIEAKINKHYAIY